MHTGLMLLQLNQSELWGGMVAEGELDSLHDLSRACMIFTLLLASHPSKKLPLQA